MSAISFFSLSLTVPATQPFQSVFRASRTWQLVRRHMTTGAVEERTVAVDGLHTVLAEGNLRTDNTAISQTPANQTHAGETRRTAPRSTGGRETADGPGRRRRGRR
jgi:hypothetical protein